MKVEELDAVPDLCRGWAVKPDEPAVVLWEDDILTNTRMTTVQCRVYGKEFTVGFSTSFEEMADDPDLCETRLHKALTVLKQDVRKYCNGRNP